jgi:hypothetical protein
MKPGDERREQHEASVYSRLYSPDCDDPGCEHLHRTHHHDNPGQRGTHPQLLSKLHKLLDKSRRWKLHLNAFRLGTQVCINDRHNVIRMKRLVIGGPILQQTATMDSTGHIRIGSMGACHYVKGNLKCYWQDV